MVAQFWAKVGVEVLFTPLSYRVAAWLKAREHEDFHDRHTNCTPFSIRT